MDKKTRARYEFRAEIFKALSHPLRISMLEKLKDKPWCVCELAVELGIEKSIASKYLSQLKSVGLVRDEKRGTLVEYSLVAPCIIEMAECAERTILESRRKQLDRVRSKA